MTNRDARATLRRTYPVRRVADYLLTHPADYVSAIADATGLSPRILRGPRGVLAAGYATLEAEQADPAEVKRPRRNYYRLTDAGRLWAAAAARLVVWRRTINLQETGASVTVSIVYLPVGGGTTQGEEAWRVELSGELSQQLTTGDANNLALLLGAGADEVVAAGQLPASDRDHQRMRRMRGQEPPDIGPLAEEGTWVLGTAGSVAGQGAGRLPRSPDGLGERG